MKDIEIPGGIITVVVGILALIIIAVLMVYGVKSFYQNREAYKLEEEQLRTAEKRLENLGKLREQYPDVTEIHDMIKKALPAKPDDDQVIDSLNNVAFKSGTSVKNIKFDEDVQKVGYLETPFSVTLDGTYDGITSAVYNMKSSERPFRVDSVEINQTPDGAKPMQAQIKGAVFYLQKTSLP
ncbi:MAG: type 4a pilus biogenesis protein PilO [Acidobacteriota bacterium]